VSKPSGNQVVTNKPDEDTLNRNRTIWERAQEVGSQPWADYNAPRVAGADPSMQGVGDQFQQGMQAGQTGMGALAGNQQDIASLMNPYQQNVIGALGTEYDRARNQAALGSNDAATQAGAFGGDRHALMVGERQGALDRSQMSDTANLLHGGFNDAMGRAGQLANLGMGAADRQFGLGDYNRQIAQQGMDVNYGNFQQQRDWGLRNLDILRGTNQGFQTGSTQSQPLHRNVGAGFIGGAATGAGVGGAFGPLGAGIGAGIGGIASLF
jgi:hypothetical protein